MSAYDAAQWSDMFVMAGGAAAALAGLVFVAVSINIDRILSIDGMPNRALQALVQLLAVVIFSLFILAPGQANTALGLELLGLSVPLMVGGVILIDRALKASGNWSPYDLRRALVIAGSAPFGIAGVSLLVEAGGGLYWVLAGVAAGVIGGVVSAWVLLVEILR